MGKEDARKYAVYSRKSKFTGKGESTANQVQLCLRYLENQGKNLEDPGYKIYEDEGFSGGNTERPGFKEMMEDIREQKIQVVICYRLDRLSRNTSDFVKMMEVFRENHVGFISISESFDTTTPMGNAMMMISSVFAQLERDTIRERIVDNECELAKTGRWLGGNRPTGYKSIEVLSESKRNDRRARKQYKLEVVEEEAEIVRMIYQKFLLFGSITKVMEYLRIHRIQTIRQKEYSAFAVKAILSNPVYAEADLAVRDYFKELGASVYGEDADYSGSYGMMVYNKTGRAEGKRRHKVKDYSEWIAAPGLHPWLIGSQDWLKTQKMLLDNKPKSYRRVKSSQALLSGILRCGDCGSHMRAKQSGRFNENGEKIYSYLCETKEKSRMHNCRMKNPNGNIMDRLVCEALFSLPEDQSEFSRRLKEAEQDFLRGTTDLEKQKKDYAKRIEKNTMRIKNLVDSLADSGDMDGYIKPEIQKLHEQNEFLKEQLEKTRLSQSELPVEEIRNLERLVKDFGYAFRHLEISQKRAMLRTFVERIVWDGENAHVYLWTGQKDAVPEPFSAGRKRDPDVPPGGEEKKPGDFSV